MLQVFSETKCLLCSQEADEYNLGKFYVLEDFSVHYLCVLTGAGLSQNGTSKEGLMGFLLQDILTAYKTYCKRICVVCKKSGASLECTTCKCRYHLPCGLKNGALVQMFGRYTCYCQNCSCKKLAMVPNSTNQSRCTICYSAIIKGDRIYSPECCTSDDIMHIDCLKEYALTSGYLMKCPLCSNKRKFRFSVRKSGVYIPNTDATWLIEDEPNDTPACAWKCSAKVCNVVDGVSHDISVNCIICDDISAHVKCTFAGIFMCIDCTHQLWPDSYATSRFGGGKGNIGVMKKVSALPKQHKWLHFVTENDEIKVRFPWVINLMKSVAHGDQLINNMMEITTEIERQLCTEQTDWNNVLEDKDKNLIIAKLKEYSQNSVKENLKASSISGTSEKVLFAKRHPAEEDLEQIRLEELRRGYLNRPRVVFGAINDSEDGEVIIRDVLAEENRQKLPITEQILKKLKIRWIPGKKIGKSNSSSRLAVPQGVTKIETCRKNKKISTPFKRSYHEK